MNNPKKISFSSFHLPRIPSLGPLLGSGRGRIEGVEVVMIRMRETSMLDQNPNLSNRNLHIGSARLSQLEIPKLYAVLTFSFF